MPPKKETFESAVERALIQELDGIAGMEDAADRIKLLAVASRYVAIRARLTTEEHGSGFEDLDNP